MPSMVAERRKFFERPEQPRPLRITARDIAILSTIARFRLVSAAQLAKLDGGSAQNVSRALLALFENGFVDRPTAQSSSRLLHNLLAHFRRDLEFPHTGIILANNVR